jgi:hypothetical protein
MSKYLFIGGPKDGWLLTQNSQDTPCYDGVIYKGHLFGPRLVFAPQYYSRKDVAERLINGYESRTAERRTLPVVEPPPTEEPMGFSKPKLTLEQRVKRIEDALLLKKQIDKVERMINEDAKVRLCPPAFTFPPSC